MDPTKVEEQVRSMTAEQERGLIPVGPQGVQIVDYAAQVRYAKDMSQANSGIPEHLRGNIGDCLAVIDIATRAGLSPYMLANETYVQNKMLCFQSKAYHALVQGYDMLKGDLSVTYEGEGGELVCIVSGYIKAEPTVKRDWKSEKLKDAHPGFVLHKRDGGGAVTKINMTYEEGKAHKRQPGEQLYCSGSPLWEKKPRVQLFYDTSRDWVRIYAPRAALGIHTPDEIREYGDTMRDITPPSDKRAELVKRLEDGKKQHTKRNRRGFNRDHVNHTVGEATGTVIDGSASGAADNGESDGTKETRTAGGDDPHVRPDEGSVDGAGNADDAGTGGGADVQDGSAGAGAAGGDEPTQAQQEIFPPDRK